MTTGRINQVATSAPGPTTGPQWAQISPRRDSSATIGPDEGRNAGFEAHKDPASGARRPAAATGRIPRHTPQNGGATRESQMHTPHQRPKCKSSLISSLKRGLSPSYKGRLLRTIKLVKPLDLSDSLLWTVLPMDRLLETSEASQPGSH